MKYIRNKVGQMRWSSNKNSFKFGENQGYYTVWVREESGNLVPLRMSHFHVTRAKEAAAGNPEDVIPLEEDDTEKFCIALLGMVITGCIGFIIGMLLA